MPLAPRITVVTCIRDEAPYLCEWVAHLRAVGVTGILAYSNDCADGSEALLDALAPAGVAHVPQGALRGRDGPAPQWRALGAAWDHPLVARAEWVAHLDCDEWPAFAPGTRGLAQLLDDADPAASAIALPWRLFGCDGRLAPGQGATPERFTRAAPPGLAFPALASFFKTIFRRAGPFAGFGVHRPRRAPADAGTPVFLDDALRPDPALTDSDRIVLWRDGRPPPGRRVQLNHYSVRSVHEFLLKRARGLPNRTAKALDLAYWVERNFNTVGCEWIAAQLPAARAELARLRALPGVAAAEAAGRAWHADRLAEILATPDGAALCGRLVLAADSTPPPAALGRALLAQRNAAAAGS